jgi:hypothetical protein
MTDPTSRQRGRPTKYRTTTFRYLPSIGKQHLVTSPRVGSTPWRSDWQTVYRKITLTLTLTCHRVSDPATLLNGISIDNSRPARYQLTATALVSFHGHHDGLAAHRLPETGTLSFRPKQRLDLTRPTRTFSARVRVSRLTLLSVRSNDWISQGQRRHSVRVCV